MTTRPKMPWGRLTRSGVPAMVVIRRPLRIDAEAPLEVGAKYPEPKDPRAVQRCRQYYEARRIGVAELKPVPVEEKKGKQSNGRLKK